MLLKAVLHTKLKNGALFWFFKIYIYSLCLANGVTGDYFSPKKYIYIYISSGKKSTPVHHNKLFLDESSRTGKLSWSVRNNRNQQQKQNKTKHLQPFDMIQEKMLEILKECHPTVFSFLFLSYWNSLKIICSPLHNEPESFPGALRQPCAGFLFSSRCEQTAAIKRGTKHDVHEPFLMGYI